MDRSVESVIATVVNKMVNGIFFLKEEQITADLLFSRRWDGYNLQTVNYIVILCARMLFVVMLL